MKACMICGSSIKELLTFDNMPASAQDIPTQEELPDDKAVSLRLCQCGSCGLVQFDTEPVHYYRDVIRAGGGTRTMAGLRQEEYERLLRAMHQKGMSGRNILEVGCGRGEFLDMWDTLENRVLKETESEQLCVTGMEHSREFVDTAVLSGRKVIRGFAGDGFADLEQPFDAFVQFNFLEHQPDPNGMLQWIRRNLIDGGLGLVTVPSFEYILQYNGYYELIRDHIANYTEKTLTYLFKKNGFRVLNTQIVNRDTIELLVEKQAAATGDTVPDFDGCYVDVQPLMDNYRRISADIHAYIAELDQTGRRLAVWGAGHQGFTLAATTMLGGKISYIIDSAPFKQGRFAPASHIPIVAPDHFFDDPVDEILIVAPGYTDEIASIIREKYGRQVHILVLRSEKITEYAEEHV